MRFSFSGRILRGQGDRPAESPVAFYLPDLRMGGAERVTVLLALHMVRRGRAACLILDNAEGELIPTVPAEVPVYGLGARRTRNAVVPLARLLRRLRPALLVSGMPYNNVVALAAARAVRPAPGVVLIEHGVPSLEIA